MKGNNTVFQFSEMLYASMENVFHSGSGSPYTHILSLDISHKSF